MGQFNSHVDKPEIARLGHVAFNTPDLEKSLSFFCDVIGLQLVEQVNGKAYLRGMMDHCHHTLVLNQSDESSVNHIGWQVQRSEHIDLFKDKLENNGVDTISVDNERGQGEAIRFDAPCGHRFELFYQIDKPKPPKHERSHLKNRVYSSDVMNRVCPRRIDHVNIRDSNSINLTNWLKDKLGFQLNEYYTNDGERWGNWMSVTSLPHDIAVGRSGAREDLSENDPKERFHHIAYRVETERDLFDAADVLSENGITVDAGPGQHAITEGKFLYVRDPASNIRIELYTGGYHIFDPNWEPIEWTGDDIGVAGDHQWIGSTPDKSMAPTISYEK